MAENEGMIEPFEPGQVRYGQDGNKLVSYGTSSYGYDVRCANEFKIFTNTHSAIVDPKNFKSYDQLKARLDKVLGFDGGDATPRTTAEDAVFDNTPDISEDVSSGLNQVDAAIAEDDDLDYFKNLAEG